MANAFWTNRFGIVVVKRPLTLGISRGCFHTAGSSTAGMAFDGASESAVKASISFPAWMSALGNSFLPLEPQSLHEREIGKFLGIAASVTFPRPWRS